MDKIRRSEMLAEYGMYEKAWKLRHGKPQRKIEVLRPDNCIRRYRNWENYYRQQNARVMELCDLYKILENDLHDSLVYRIRRLSASRTVILGMVRYGTGIGELPLSCPEYGKEPFENVRTEVLQQLCGTSNGKTAIIDTLMKLAEGGDKGYFFARTFEDVRWRNRAIRLVWHRTSGELLLQLSENDIGREGSAFGIREEKL